MVVRNKKVSIHIGWAICMGTKNPAVAKVIKPMIKDLVAAAPT